MGETNSASQGGAEVDELKRPHDPRFCLAVRVFFGRSVRGWTQQQLADAAGMTQTQISFIEGQRSNPTIDTLDALAAVFGWSPATLLTDPRPEVQVDAPPDLASEDRAGADHATPTTRAVEEPR